MSGDLLLRRWLLLPIVPLFFALSGSGDLQPVETREDVCSPVRRAERTGIDHPAFQRRQGPVVGQDTTRTRICPEKSALFVRPTQTADLVECRCPGSRGCEILMPFLADSFDARGPPA